MIIISKSYSYSPIYDNHTHDDVVVEFSHRKLKPPSPRPEFCNWNLPHNSFFPLSWSPWQNSSLAPCSSCLPICPLLIFPTFLSCSWWACYLYQSPSADHSLQCLLLLRWRSTFCLYCLWLLSLVMFLYWKFVAAIFVSKTSFQHLNPKG